MEALIELCDLIADNPDQFNDKLTWICGRCPTPETLNSSSPRVSRSQLHAVLAIARFLSKCPNCEDDRPRTVVLEILRSIPSSFKQSFWPPSFGNGFIVSFYGDFLGYVSKAAESSLDFGEEVAEFIGGIVISAVNNGGEDVAISRAFLSCLSKSFLPIVPSDANKLVSCLFDCFEFSAANAKEQGSLSMDASSTKSSPLNDSTSSSSQGLVMNGSSIAWKSSDLIATGIGGFNDGYKRVIASFEEESVESLEKQEIAFKLIGHILDKVQIDPKLLEQVRNIAKEQLHSMLAFLKVKVFWVSNHWFEK